MNEGHELYYATLAADEAFSSAIKAQFGPKPSRWDYPNRAYNAATRAAYHAKVAADKAHSAWMLKDVTYS